MAPNEAAALSLGAPGDAIFSLSRLLLKPATGRGHATPRIVTSGGVDTAFRVPKSPASAMPIPPPPIPINGIIKLMA